MYCYIITLDLNNKENDYSELVKAIKKLGNCRKALNSCWIVETTVKSNDITYLIILKMMIDYLLENLAEKLHG